MNRLFDQAQKKYLYLQSGGRCERCGDALREEWDAHHVLRHVDGGVTEVTNAVALCKACHREIHRSFKVIKPRGWQVQAIEKFHASEGKSFLVEATPGSGKTIFSGLCAKGLLDEGAIDFVVVVVPTKALKGGKNSGFLGDWHKVGVELTSVLKGGSGWPRDFNGGVVTYQQLPNIASHFKTWAQNGLRMLFVFDEVHHASEVNTWGATAEQCGDAAVRILAMTGTPFRGDNQRISFVRYADEGTAIADHRYTYRQAVAQGDCREVFFRSDDGVTKYIYQEELQEQRVSEVSDEDAGRTTAALFNPGQSEWLDKVLIEADEALDNYRITDVDAGGIIICRPGATDNDDRHLEKVAKRLRELTNERAEVITHDDPDAIAKIDSFRKGATKWICAVRMISEGVDIKRLRVMVMANRPTTELLFRQMVGRVVRVENRNHPEDSTVFIADFPQLRQWAKQIADEAAAGVRDRKPTTREGSDDPRATGDFIPLGADPAGSIGISDFGEVFTATEVTFAESLKRNDAQLADLSVSKIAHLLRKLNVKVPEDEAPDEPLHDRKMRLRKDINKLGRQLAYRIDPEEPKFWMVWQHVNQVTGVKNINDLFDNYDIARAEQVKELLENMLKDFSHAA
jgi:superfamily II DNA or RNA helicase